MSEYLDLAVDYLGVTKEQCLVLREVEGQVIVVVDNGILGCPKYVIPISELTIKNVPLPFDEEPEPEPEPEEEEFEYQEIDLDVESIDYRQLQQMAKELDIPANQSRDDLIAALGLEDE